MAWPRELDFVVGGWWWLAVVVVVCTVLAVRSGFERFRRRRRALAATSAERRAARLLERDGYAVLQRQVTCSWPVVVGGRSVKVSLRADYLVGRGRESFVAEVKNGAYVARIRHGPTRRQLLEYQLAYGVDGVLLVDVERQRIDRVFFPAIRER